MKKKLGKNFLLCFMAIVIFVSLTTASFAIDTKSENSKSYLKGDLDMNEEIQISDVVLLRLHIVNGGELTDTQFLIADLNNDGSIDVADVTIIRSHIVGNVEIKEKIYIPTTTTDIGASSTTVSTNKPVSDIPVSVTLEAEDADLSNEYSIYNDKTASGNEYVETAKDTVLSFALPDNAYSGSYDIIVISRFTNGESANSLCIDDNVIGEIEGDSTNWDSYYFSGIIVGKDNTINIKMGDGYFDVDCILLYSRYIMATTTTTTTTTATGSNSGSTSVTTATTGSQTEPTGTGTETVTTPTVTTDDSQNSSSATTQSTSKTTKSTTSTTTTTDLSIADGMYVNGTTLYDSYGNPFIMRGINIAHCWWSNYTANSLQGASNLGANSVRIVLSDGSQYTKTTAGSLESMLILCKKYKLIAVVELHDYTGDNNASDITACANYWIEMADILNKYQKCCIVNIANEWMGSWNQGSTWTNAYSSGVRSMRNAGIKNVIMIDSPGWGQDANTMINSCQSVKAADTTGNIMFSIHMYGTAGGSQSTIRNHIDGALGKGVCLCIGEFGYTHSDGDVDEQFIMQYCNTKNVGYLGWSWKGNGGGVEYLDMADDWGGSTLTEWGNNIFYSTYGISATAKRASNYQ